MSRRWTRPHPEPDSTPNELARLLREYAAEVMELAESVRIKALRVQREEEMRRGR